MSKQAFELKPNFGPCYAAAVYPDLAALFHKHGYALAVHGSLARDLDLIAIPWMAKVSPVERVLAKIRRRYNMREIGEPEKREHGRLAYTFSIGWGACSIDLSFFPPLQDTPELKGAVKQSGWAVVQSEDKSPEHDVNFVRKYKHQAISALVYYRWNERSVPDRERDSDLGNVEWMDALDDGWRTVEVDVWVKPKGKT